jgi:hypothetical protein
VRLRARECPSGSGSGPRVAASTRA